ncbi:uncharacterized protein LOC110022160 [Phalaenopsis equestris]|uniref:uncharacterized protein LOC110022160 n=1 Tax=Phalaenopsis equestris TaxID=78828 RepID=UPI0009E201F5|nr:uncharacterized protein LOC110022160 [Phalaenopsis equestris]
MENPSTTKKKKKKQQPSSSQPDSENIHTNPFISSFFLAMEDPKTHRRQSSLTSVFSSMPHNDDDPSQVLIMSALWTYAMTQPDDPILPSSGLLLCCSLLITKSLTNPSWLHRHQNIYIPYYAAHILGSFTLRHPTLASLAISSGCLPPLLSLLRGSLTWMEQRAAVRALGHLASFDNTFPAVELHGADIIIPFSIHLATTSIETVFSSPRQRYQRDLLTRGLGGADMEAMKAEQWAGQLQTWSIYLLSCFAWRDFKWHRIIVTENANFLKKVCNMWGGLANGDSPAGVGLMRILCRSVLGRTAIAGCVEAVESLCNLSRSSDDWQYMGIDCLLLLLNDPVTHNQVFPITSPYLTDLAELRRLGSREHLGEKITNSLPLTALIQRTKKEAEMSLEETEQRWKLSRELKRKGNQRFRVGDVEGAIEMYTEALMECPLRKREQRMVIYSNRAKCEVMIGEADAAISDSTRALALSEPANSHGKSLWWRAQGYDMKGMAKESLMDCLSFLNWWFGYYEGKRGRFGGVVPCSAVRMIRKQMGRVGLFDGVKEKCGGEDASADGDE